MANIHEALAKARAAGDTEAVKMFEADLERMGGSVMNEPRGAKATAIDIGKNLLSGVSAPAVTALNLTRDYGPKSYQDFVDRVQGGRDRLRENQSGVGKVAETVGEIGVSMLPASKAAQGFKVAANVIPKVGRFIGAAGAPVVEGATAGAMTSPNDVSGGAQSGAIGGAVGGLVGKAAGGAWKGLYGNNPVASRMIAEGYPLTPGQARGGIMEGVERGLEKIPGAGYPLKKSREASYKDYPYQKIESTRLPSEFGDIAPRNLSIDEIMANRQAAHSAFTPTKRQMNAYEEAQKNLALLDKARKGTSGTQGAFNPTQLEGHVRADPTHPLFKDVSEEASILNRPRPSDNDYWKAIALTGLVGGNVYVPELASGPSAALGGLSLLLGTKGGRKFITGDLAAQKYMADKVRRGILPSAGNIGGVIAGHDQPGEQ